jgi:hypothetical protein
VFLSVGTGLLVKSFIGMIQRPLGYRAPAFSITNRSRWAGRILADQGFRYSSSIFPIRKRRSVAKRFKYNIPSAYCNLDR